MADFCWQCYERHGFGPPENNDLRGGSTEKDTKKGLFSLVICEGCGVIQVDHLGKCISEDCEICSPGHNNKEVAA
jgi:hypothetical protein